MDAFLEKRGRNLSVREREWLEAQRRSWLGIWETQDIDPGVALTAMDLLSGEKRRIHEKLGSTNLKKRDTMLARVVDFEGISVFCGSHPRPLPPRAVDEVVSQVRKHLRLKQSIPVERLRDYQLNRRMVEWWENAVEHLDFSSRQRPSLSNTDGDPLLLTIDRYRFDPSRLSEIESALSRMKGIILPEPGSTNRQYVFERINPPNSALPSTTIGQVRFEETTLVAETNSIKRADTLRANLEAACGRLLQFRTREHVDPRSLRDQKHTNSAEEADEIPADVRHQIIREFKKRHYKAWLDQPIPALDGKTPQQAVHSKAGRHKLDVLLKDIENSEQRLDPGERFDITELRRELGLDR